MQVSLSEYVKSLYRSSNFDEAFLVFQSAVFDMGLDGVIYTYIPKPLIQSNFTREPVYRVSDGFCPEYLAHYRQARLERHDLLIKAVTDGAPPPIDWWGPTCDFYMQNDNNSRNVIELARSYGIQNGMTIPLTAGEKGIAGATFICRDSSLYQTIIEENLDNVKLFTTLFHTFVLSKTSYRQQFETPLLESFSKTQLRYVAGLVAGKKTAEIAAELGTSPGYLDQTMLKLRRKLSGVTDQESPEITRNQVIYLAGTLNILEYDLQA